MRMREDRLDVRPLTRTTRSVAATEAGERLLAVLRPALADIEAGLAGVRSARDTPAGTVRITAVKHAATSLLMPVLPGFARRYPDIRVEVDVDDGMQDVVARGYDAGIRFGGSVDQDMVAVRIGAPIGVAVMASPGYLAQRPPPATPRDLADHSCILHRRPGGGTYPWPLHENGRPCPVRVDGPLAFSDSDLVLDAALAGQGFACVFADCAAPHEARRRLVRVLASWTATLPGYALYYPSRRQNPPALAAFIAHLRGREPA